MISHAGMERRLAQAIRDAGGPSAFARLAGVSKGYVTDLAKRRRDPGPKILAVLGLRVTVTTVRTYDEVSP